MRARTRTLRLTGSTTGSMTCTLPLKRCPGSGVDGQRDRLADVYQRQIGFRDRYFKFQGAECVQSHDIVAFLDVGAGADLPQPGHCVKRRSQHGLVERDLFLTQPRAQDVEVGARFIQCLAGNEILRDQFLAALVAAFR